jgi:HlyD family secretion protein
MSKKTWILLSLSLAAVVALFAWLFRDAPVEVDSARVVRGVFTLLVEEDGVTRVRDRYVVAAPVAGMLVRPALRPGDKVARGDAVAVILPNPAQMLDARTRNELAARVEAASAQASRARSVLRQAEAAAFQADNEHRRLKELGSSGYVSPTELERSTLTLELRRKDVEAARFDADAAEHDLAQARAAQRDGQSLSDPARQRNAWTVNAPVDGTVLAVRQESEAPVGIGTPILEIGDLSRLEARIDVLSTEATRIQEHAYVNLDAGGLALSGRVRRIEPSGYTKISALGIEEQRVDVLVDLLPNPVALEHVADGYRVDAAIEVERQEDVILVPLAALFRQGDRWATYRLEDGRARLTLLRIGTRGSTQATVLEGIAEEDAVIVYPSDAIRDGIRVIARQ